MKTGSKIFATFIAIFITIELIFIAIFIHTLLVIDLSLQPIYKQNKSSLDSSLYLISYADGPEIFFKNRNILAYSAINRGVDFIYNYRRQHIAPDFINKHNILNRSIGAGYWLWKPYLILKTLNEIPEGSIVLYADSGLLIRQPIRNFIDANFAVDSNKDLLLFSYNPKDYSLPGGIATGDTFDALNCRLDRCRYGHHIWAGILVIKNTYKSKKFIKEWLDSCSNPDLLTGRNLQNINYPEFTHHQHDEAILSVLANREANLINFIKMDKIFFEYFWMHRRKVDRQNESLLGFTNLNLIRFERKLFNRPIIRNLRYIVEQLFKK